MKTLIIYFSWSNNTKNLIQELNKTFNLDVVRVERATPYSNDYNECAYVEAKEEWQNKSYPLIKDINVDINSYDKILLFFPIWWYTFPRPIATLVREYLNNYTGKVVVFANSYTNDYAYMDNSIRDLNEINHNLDLSIGLFNKTTKEHIDFIKKEI